MMVDWLLTNAFGSGIETVKYAITNTTAPRMKPIPLPNITSRSANCLMRSRSHSTPVAMIKGYWGYLRLPAPGRYQAFTRPLSRAAPVR